MNKPHLFTVLMLVFVLTVSGSVFIVSYNHYTAPSIHNNFNFVFRWGIEDVMIDVGKYNELNTFNNTFTKDMVLDPMITINFSLTRTEMDNIYLKLVEISFFDLVSDCFSVRQTSISFLISESGIS